MAANGFIELLRLARRSKRSHDISKQEEYRWSGIAFEMMGQYFVAPLGEVAEVIYPPKYTLVPKTQDWVRGLANVRGRLLSVSDLPHFLTGTRSPFLPTQKVLCISYQDHYIGLMVDQVLGIQHFNKNSFFKQTEEFDAKLKPYCPGYFRQYQKQWQVFLLSQLIKDSHYMDASMQS